MKETSKQLRAKQMGSWLDDIRYKAVLRATHTAAFEFDPHMNRQEVSSFINEMVAGNYDGRFLSQVMLEDGVIFPEDIPYSLAFKEQVKNGDEGEMVLRLLTPNGEYHWFRISITSCQTEERSVFVGIVSDVDSEIRQREILRYRAEYDPTSGIYNKTTFYEKTKKLLSEHPDQTHYILQFDVDRFKLVNELYSVSEGDLVLRYIGSLLRELALEKETYSRLGNDVFCVCLIRSKKETIGYIEELEQKINLYPISFHFMLSVGIFQVEQYKGEPINILCDRAAMAQRTIKGQYVKRYAFYHPSMSHSLNREHYITGCMENALQSGQFQIFLQPKVDMRDNHMVGAEALARWIHPTEGMISPAEFIPLFERNGFILRLDEAIWELACQTLRRWTDNGWNNIPISVNVSRVHLHDPDFCNKMLSLCKKYELPPRLLELEITESAYTEHSQALYEIMDQLQEMGFVFSMDDFGSGYSSLNVLKDIPVDIIKIDLKFLSKSRRGEGIGNEVLKGTIQLVQNLNLTVIVEGVENEEQVNYLKSIGCTCAQGYYYAKPLPVSEFEKRFLEKGN